jgi:hypothetical protein
MFVASDVTVSSHDNSKVVPGISDDWRKPLEEITLPNGPLVENGLALCEVWRSSG